MNKPMLTLLWTCLGCLAVSVAPVANAAVPVAADLPAISVGVVPQQAARKLVRSWGPLLRYLEAGTGRRFTFMTAPDIPTFEQRLAAGEYDISYMNPYHYSVFHDAVGYQAFAKAKDKRIHGILVVARDSPIQRLDQLNGATLAFPAPGAFAASMLPRANLARSGIRFTPDYVSSHDSVYRAVASGLYPAGGGVMRTLKGTSPDVRDRLRVLWQTPGYTPHALAAHPRVDAAVVRQVQALLSGMSDDSAGRPLLDNLGFKGFEPTWNADWDDVRELGLTTKLGDS